ncbi:MAG: hypothetical protein ABI780_02680 [Ardenticatenales bacterium]
MPSAGEYRDRLEWKLHTYGDPDSFGQKPDVYTSQGYLWGAVDDVAGGNADYLESDQPSTSATIRLRNAPAVNPLDQLIDAGRSETWFVSNITRGDNEVICQVSR